MNRLVFEDDDVIQRALVVDSDSDEDCTLIDTGPIASKENIKKSLSDNQNVSKTNVDEKFTNKEIKKKQASDDKHQCQKCLQEYEKKELDNHDCAKKKRKSLVLSFHRNLSRTSSLSAKNIRKSHIKNYTAKSDKINSVDSNTSEKNCKENGNKLSKFDQITRVSDGKELSFEIKQSKTPIFYECSVCLQHFNKNEFDSHICRDNSPCLTLTFPMSSSFNDSVGKHDKNTSKRATKSVTFEELPRNDSKTVIHKEKAQLKQRKDDSTSFSTESKQPITSQHFENEKATKKLNQSITLENKNQNATKNKKSMKRKTDSVMSTEKEFELRSKNRKIDKQNIEANQSADSTLEGSIGDVNKIVAIETPSQNLRTKNTDRLNDQKDKYKNENSDQSKTIYPKSIPQIEKTTVGNELSKVKHNQVRWFNEKNIDKTEKSKRIEKSCNVVLHKIDTEQNVLSKEILESAKEIVTKSHSKESTTVKNSNKLVKHDKISSQSIDKTSTKDKKSSKNVFKKVRFSKRLLLEKEKEGILQNLVNKEAEVVPLHIKRETKNEYSNKQDDSTNNEISNQKEVCDKIPKRDKKSTENIKMKDNSETYKMFRLNELKFILEKEDKGNQNLEHTEAKVTTRSQQKFRTEKESSNNQQEADRKKTIIKSDELLRQSEISQSSVRISKRRVKTSKNVIKTVISENYKLFRLNELKVLLEKEKVGRCNGKAVNTTQNEKDCSTENNNSNNQEIEDNRYLKNVEAVFSKEGKVNRNLKNKEAKVDTTRNEQKIRTENESFNKQKEAKEIVIKSQSKQRKMVQNFYESLKQDKILQSTNGISKINEKTSRNVNKNIISETYKLFRLNELKVLLEKEKDNGNQNLECKEAKRVPRKEQDCRNENGNSNNQQGKEGNPNFENIEADLSLNEKNVSNALEKSIKIESDQEAKTKTEIIKKNKRQKRYKCRICNAKYTKIKHRKHICKNKVKKTKSKRQILKKSDVLKNLKDNSQNKVNITILSHENVKVVTVSNNAKDYEVNQGNISNYVSSDEIPKQNEIKETTEQILTNKITTKKSSIETVSQRLRNIAEEKAIEKEKVALYASQKAKPITEQKSSEKHLHQLNEDLNKTLLEKSLIKDKAIESEIISKEFICEENSKIQENITTSFKESDKQNKNEKYDDKLLKNTSQNNSNSKKIENTILSENIDHSYTTTGVENMLSINTVDSETSIPFQNIEHDYSVSETNISTDKIDDINTKTTENNTILTNNKRAINGDEINTNINEENETITNENKEKEIITKNSQTISESKEIKTKHEENQLLESTKMENVLIHDLRSSGHKNKSHEVNIPKMSTERIRFIEIIDMFVCTRCSQEFSENDIKNHVCSKNTDIILDRVPQIEKPNDNAERVVIALIDDEESDITVPEIVGSEVTISEKREITVSESDIIIPQSEMTIPETEITIPEIVASEIIATTQNENTTLIPDIDIEILNQIAGIGNEMIISNENVANEVIITTQSKGLDNNELTLEVNKVDNVAQDIIIPALIEEIPIEEIEIVSDNVENPVATAAKIEHDSFVAIENVQQEVIITTDDTETDDMSIKNVGDQIVVLTDKVVSTDNIVESSKRARSILIKNAKSITNENVGHEIIKTTKIENNDNITLTHIKGNKKHANSKSTGLIYNKQHKITTNINKQKSDTKILAKNIEQKIEKVSVESLENQVFVSKYVGANDSIKDVQIKDNVSTKNDKASDLIENVQSSFVSKLDETSIYSIQAQTNDIARDSAKDAQNETNVSTKCIGTSDSINETNISTPNDNVSVENMTNTNRGVTEADRNETTVNMNIGNNVLVPNEITSSAGKEDCVLASQSKQIEKITPTDDEIETIIIISSENENKKNIVLTQNKNNETVIIITKQKEEKSDHTTTIQSKIKEITEQNHQNVPSPTEKDEVKTKNERECSKCLKKIIEDELKTHICTEKVRNEIKESSDETIGVKEKENNILSIETQLAAILNQGDSQNTLSEPQDHSSNSVKTKSDKKKEENALETQLAAILNQNEPQNKIADKREHSQISSANNIREDHMYVENNENKGSSLTNNQLLDILSTQAENTSLVENSNQDATQKDNSDKTKCFRCSKDFTDRELTTHNCLEYKEKTSNLEIEKATATLEKNIKKSRETDQNSDEIEKNTTEATKSKQNNDTAETNLLNVIEIQENSKSVEEISTDHKTTKTKGIRCFNCSEIYNKTHICPNIGKETETDNDKTALKKPDANKQDESQLEDSTYKKKRNNKYFFDPYVIKINDRYECKLCKKQYTARKNLVTHIHQHEIGAKERFGCSFCSKKFQYKQSLKSHEACHTGVKYDCSICDKSFSRKSNLNTHSQLHKEETFSCDNCGKDYSTKRYLLSHPCFNTKLYSCDFCDKKYKQKFNLIDHLHAHVGLKPYKCEFCKEEIASRSKYMTHTENCSVAKEKRESMMENNETINEFTCKICLKTLPNKSQLQKHEWKHENKQLSCNICPKTFKSKHYLQLHLASHQELGLERQKFECPDCDKQFSTKFGLKLHLNIHNGVKFSCPLCEKLFSTKLLLQAHERTHTGQTAFKCKFCNKGFNHRSNLNRHTKHKVCLFLPMALDD